MGGDSAGIDDNNDLMQRKDSKVFILKKQFIIGFTSSFRMGQILKYSFGPPEHPSGMGVEKYMNTLFVDEVRKVFKDKGFLLLIDDSQEQGGTFLVGYKKRLFAILDDFQIGESIGKFYSVGAGESYAIGAMEVTKTIKPRQRILKALAVAEKFNGSVRRPFVVKRLKHV